jgi:hypothetical protein
MMIILVNDMFDVDYVTKKLEISPTHTHKKGDKGEYVKELKDTCWILHTGYQEVEYIDDVLIELMKILLPKIDLIKEIKSELNLKAEFSILIKLNSRNHFSNACSLDQDILNFACQIGAPFHIGITVVED